MPAERCSIEFAGSLQDYPSPYKAGEPHLEVDELWAFLKAKSNEYWVAYAMDRISREVIDFVVGKRIKATLNELVGGLLPLKLEVIYTDKLILYKRLIPKTMHRAGANDINRIERKNVSIRTHLKRLSRRAICFSRSLKMLESCLCIYFWGMMFVGQVTL